jgi:hypothetical protein
MTIQDNKGRFTKGNPGGKLKAPVSARNRAIAEVCRELFEEFGDKTAREIFQSKNNWPVKVKLLELVIERGYGKSPLTVKLGNSIDPNSPEGVLLLAAGQSLPGGNE